MRTLAPQCSVEEPDMVNRFGRTILLAVLLLTSALALAGAEQGCAWAKQQPDKTPVDFGNLVVTAKFTGYIYAQHPTGQAGIRIVTSDTSVNERDLIFVHGAVGTSGPERVINAGSIDTIARNWRDQPPRAMSNRDLGGGTSGTPPNCQGGPVGGLGLNNIGLLVRIWGRVTAKVQEETYVVIEDGTGTPVRVDCSKLSSLPERGDYIGATGISSLQNVGLRLLLTRKDSDVTVYSHAGG
jgi:hypothetical protein